MKNIRITHIVIACLILQALVGAGMALSYPDDFRRLWWVFLLAAAPLLYALFRPRGRNPAT